MPKFLIAAKGYNAEQLLLALAPLEQSPGVEIKALEKPDGTRSLDTVIQLAGFAGAGLFSIVGTIITLWKLANDARANELKSKELDMKEQELLKKNVPLPGPPFIYTVDFGNQAPFISSTTADGKLKPEDQTKLDAMNPDDVQSIKID